MTCNHIDEALHEASYAAPDGRHDPGVRPRVSANVQAVG